MGSCFSAGPKVEGGGSSAPTGFALTTGKPAPQISHPKGLKEPLTTPESFGHAQVKTDRVVYPQGHENMGQVQE